MNTFTIKTKTSDGFLERIIFQKTNNNTVMIEQRYLVPIRALKNYQSYQKIRKFKDKYLISTHMTFKIEAMLSLLDGVRYLLKRDILLRNIDY
jgi:hypothetical protein